MFFLFFLAEVVTMLATGAWRGHNFRQDYVFTDSC